MKHVLTIKKRSEQNPADCWSVEDLFPSDQAWEEAFAACQSLPEELKQLCAILSKLRRHLEE